MRIIIWMLCFLVMNAYAWSDTDETEENSVLYNASVWEYGEEYDEQTRIQRAKEGMIERVDAPLAQQPITPEGVKTLTQYAESGDTDAQWRLCTVYGLGRATLYGIIADREKAFYWCKKSAEQGNARAQYWLAKLYQQDVITDVSVNNRSIRYSFNHTARDNLFYWLTRSAEQGDYMAQYDLGIAYVYRLIDFFPLDVDELGILDRARILLKFKWVCLGWERMPSKHWLKDTGKRECGGWPEERVSEPEREQIVQAIIDYKPKNDIEAQAIASALVSKGGRKKDQPPAEYTLGPERTDQALKTDFLRRYRVQNRPN